VSIIDRVTELVTEIIDPFGLGLYDVELNGGTLRVTVQGDDGVSLDRLAEITRLLSRALDADDPMPGRYTLEVSSPGLERRLRTPAHFVGAVGEAVTVKVEPGAEGARRVRGLITDVADGTVEMLADDGVAHRIALDHITRAVTVFEWGPTPKPGSVGGQRNARTAPPPDASPADAATDPERRAAAR